MNNELSHLAPKELKRPFQLKAKRKKTLHYFNKMCYANFFSLLMCWKSDPLRRYPCAFSSHILILLKHFFLKKKPFKERIALYTMSTVLDKMGNKIPKYYQYVFIKTKVRAVFLSFSC